MKYFFFLFSTLLTVNCSMTEIQVQPEGQASDNPEVLAAVNNLRAQGCRCGLKRMPAVPPLSWDNRLTIAAKRHAGDMAQNNFFDHNGSDGSNVSSRATDAGYNWRRIGENIAYNYPDAESVVKGWQESPSHCKNMMSADFNQMGAAYIDGYWVQVLGKPKATP